MRVQQVGEGPRRAGKVEADDGEDEVQGDVHEDIEEDGRGGQLVYGTRLEGAGEGGPVFKG